MHALDSRNQQAVVLKRGEKETLMPDPGTRLQAGERLFFCGERQARTLQSGLLQFQRAELSAHRAGHPWRQGLEIDGTAR